MVEGFLFWEHGLHASANGMICLKFKGTSNKPLFLSTGYSLQDPKKEVLTCLGWPHFPLRRVAPTGGVAPLDP